MFCNQCGTPLVKDARFCVRCGTSVASMMVVEDAPAPVTAPLITNTAPTERVSVETFIRGMRPLPSLDEAAPTPPPAPPIGDAARVHFVREDFDSVATWRVHRAPNSADAMAFLLQQNVSEPLYYLVVETPEGNFGRDKNGIYQE